MAFDPNLDEQALLAATFARPRVGMAARELVTEVLVGVGFAAATVALWVAQPPQAVAIAPALLCSALFVLATLVRFDTPFGFTVATQVAFVPLLFALPVTLVPIVVVLALAIVRLPGVIAGRSRPVRLLHTLGNAWFAVGPVAVFVAAGTLPRDAGAELLLAALGAQFLVDFAASTLRFTGGRSASLASQLRETTWVSLIDAGLSVIGLVVAEEIHTTPLAAAALLPLLGLLATFARERRGRLEQLLELNNAYRGTALVLGDVVEADDGYTGEHCKSVVRLALAVGAELGLSAQQLRNLEFGALLHDVGKIAIPKEIINKPGKLDPAEWTIIKTHTSEGQRMLDRVGGFMREVGLIVRCHHERWDGGGYPDGLSGDAIPLEARIIACCDTWNAMRTDRCYRKALPHPVAAAELFANAGSQLDPRAVEALLRIVTSAGDGEPQPEAPAPIKPALSPQPITALAGARAA